MGTMEVGQLLIKMAADTAQLRADMDQAKAAVGGAMAEITRAAETARNALAALGVVTTVTGFAALVEKTIESAAEMYKLAQRTGVAVESLSALRGVAKLSGTDMADVGTGLQKLSKNMVEAQTGSGKAAASFAALGVSVTDSSGHLKSADQVMLETAKAMQGFEQGAGLTTAAMNIFGKAGANLIPMLAELAEKGNLNGKMTTEQARQALEFEKALIKQKTALEGVARTLAIDLIPIVTKAAGLFEPALKVGAAYLTLFVGVPAVMTAATAAFNAYALAVYNGTTATALFAASMTTTVTATRAAIVEFGLLKSAAALALAGFAGWEIGTWMRENFLEAQLAAVAFVEGTMVGWEKIKFGASAAWLVVKKVVFDALNGIADLWAQQIAMIGSGLQALGMDSAAAKVNGYAQALQSATHINFDFNAELAKLGAESDTAVAAVRAITGDMADEAIAHFKSADAVSTHKKRLADVNGELGKAPNKYAELIAASNAHIAMLRLQAEGGDKLTDGEKKLQEMQAQVAAGTLKYNDAQFKAAQATFARNSEEEKAIRQQQESTKATQEAVAARVKEALAMDANVAKIQDELAQQRAANDVLRGLKDASEELKIAKLNEAAASADRQAINAMERTGDEKLAQTFRDQAKALRDLAAAKGEGVQLKAAQEAANEWKKVTDSIQNGLTDALFRGFENGKSFFVNFRDTLVSMFKQLVLQPTIRAVFAPVAGSVGSLLGAPAQAGQAVGGLGGLGSLGSLFGAGGGSLLGAGSAFGSGLQLTLGGSGGTGLALDGAAAMLGEGQIGAGLMQGAGALGPYAAAAVAIYSLAKSLDKSGTPHMGSVVTANSLGAITGGADPTRILDHYNKDTDTALKSLLGGSVGTLNSLSTAFGGAADFSALGKFAADNTDSSFGGLQLNRGSSLIGQITRPGGDAAAYDKDPTKAFASYAADVAKQVRAAIDTINLPDWATKKLSALTESATIDDIAKVADEVVKTAAALEDFKANIRAMGVSFASLSQISDESLMALTNAAGGLDQLKSGLKTYYGVYFSDAEKAAMQTAAISDELKKYGIDVLPHTREEFRKLVEAQDLTTQSGIDAYAALLRVASAFDAVMNSGEAAAEASKKAADEAAKKARVDLNSQPISGGVDATGLKAMVDYEVQRQTLQANITPYIATLKSQLSTGQAVPEWIERYLTQPIGDLEARIESVAQVQLAQDMAYAERQKTADQNAQAYLQDIAQQLGNRPGGPNREELALQAQNKATLDLIASLDKVHDALVGYKDQLTFGKFSSLGVEGQYAESRKMLDSIFGQAMANDAVARSRFTSVADQFLGLSQQNFGSTGGFYTDKDYVLTLIDKLTNKIDQLHQTAVDGNVIAQAGAAATVDALQDNNAMAASVVGQAALQKARSV